MSSTTILPVHHEFTFADAFHILQRRRTAVIVTILGCFVVAALICIFMPRSYTAIGELEVSKQSADDLRLDGMKGTEDSTTDALEENIALQTQANILQSDTLALRVIEKLNLEHTEDFTASFNPLGWAMNTISPQGTPDPSGARLEDSPRRRTSLVRTFQSRLRVSLVPGTQLIEIRYRSHTPRVASDVVNQLMKGLGDYTFETRYDATVQASQWLNGQMDDLKRNAEHAQARVVQLQREAGVYSLGGTDTNGQTMTYSATLDSLQQATQSLTQSTSNRILKGGIYETVRHGDPEAISGLAGSSLSNTSQGSNTSLNLLQILRAQQSTLQAQLSADTSKYGDANPKLQDERASLAGVGADIQREVARIGERAENDYKAAQLTEQNLRANYDQQRAAADQLNNKAVEYAIARQEATESRDLYDTLYQHLKEAGVIEGFRSSNLSIVDPARVPGKPSRPNVPVYLALSLVGGVFLGGVEALFLDSVDGRIQNLATIEQSLKTPLLGVVPFAEFSARRKNTEPTSGHREQRKFGLSITPPRIGGRAEQEEPSTAFYESLATLRTAVLLSRSSAPPKVIIVTSAAESEGKTTISLYLAAAMARNQKKVLLVEADMRRPTIAERLNLSNARGLSNLLSSDADVAPFHALPGSSADLAILPAGPTPPYPADLLGSDRMKELIDAWLKEYDFILIDTPSALAVADATVLTRFADLTLLVSRHAQSSRKSLERAYHTLKFDAVNRIGVVLNGVRRGSAAYKEYFGYVGDRYY